MQAKYKHAIMKKRKLLLKNIDPDIAADEAYAERIIVKHEQEAVTKDLSLCGVTRRKVNVFLEKLLLHDDTAWHWFMEFLRNECNQSWIAVELEDAAGSYIENPAINIPAKQLSAITMNTIPSITTEECFEATKRLRSRLINMYSSEAYSTIKVFPGSKFGKLPIDETYVAFGMKKQKEIKDDNEAYRMQQPEIQPLRPSERTENYVSFLSSLFSKTNQMAMPKPVIIMGDPGQGKTTLMNKIAHDWAMAQKGVKPHELLEEITLLFAYSLRNLSLQTISILDFILAPEVLPEIVKDDIIRARKWIEDNSMKVLVILDGLDELSVNCSELETILTERPPHIPNFPLLIMTRSYAIPKQCPWALRFELCGPNARQACDLVTKYGECLHAPAAVTHEVIEFCCEEENIFLLTSPLLLQLICWFAFTTYEMDGDEKYDVQLPRSQTKTYFAIVDWMLRRQNMKNGVKSHFSAAIWTSENLVSKLSKFAFEKTFATEFSARQIVFDRADVHSAITEEYTNDAIEAGFLVTDALFYGSYGSTRLKLSFPHRTFQEFFAAIHVVTKIDADRREKLLCDEIEFTKNASQVALFSIGVAWETNNESATVILKMVIDRILRRIRDSASYDGYRHNQWILMFLKSVFREARTSYARKTTLRNWFLKSDELECLAVESLEDGRADIVDVFDCLLTFVRFPAIRWMRIFDRNFLCYFSTPVRHGRTICVIHLSEFNAEFRYEKEKGAVHDKAISVPRGTENIASFIYHGSVIGATSFLGEHSFVAEYATLNISKQPLRRLFAAPNSESDENNMLLNKVDPTETIVFKTLHLKLSSLLTPSELQLLLASVVTNIQADEINCEFFSEPDIYNSPTAAIANEEIPIERVSVLNHVKHLRLENSKDRYGILPNAIPNIRTFVEVLRSVDEVGYLTLNDVVLQLWHTMAEKRPALKVFRIINLNYTWNDEMAKTLAMFVAKTRTKYLNILLSRRTAEGRKKSFEAFCSGLSVLSEQVNLRTLTISEFAMDIEANFAEIFESLVHLLREFPKMKLVFGPNFYSAAIFNSFPSEVQLRVLRKSQLQQPSN